MDKEIPQEMKVVGEEEGGDPRDRVIILLQEAWERFLADEALAEAA